MQHEIQSYRVDFAMLLRNFANNIMRIVVECNGHEFREEAEQQASRDRKRVHDLQLAEWKVLQATGSEIVREVSVCVDEISDIAVDWIEESIPHSQNAKEDPT
jgi:very-short-patch-repair endonuclease